MTIDLDGDLGSELLLQTVAALDTGVLICHADGEIAYVNPACAALFETEQSTLVGTDFWTLADAVSEADFEGYRESAPDSDPKPVEARYSYADTQVVVEETTVRTTVDDATYLLVFLKDTSEHTLLERELEIKNEQLRSQYEQLEAQQDRFESFARIASRDFRDPLHLAKGYLATAQANTSMPSLDRVDDALSRMETLVDELRSLAEEGQSVGDVESVSLEAIATAAWEATTTFDAELTVEEYEIYADPLRTQQLFEAVFRNIIDYAGPEVTVRVGGMSQIGTTTRVDSGSELASGFYIADDGPGVPAAAHEHVFADSDSDSDVDAETPFELRTATAIAKTHGWRTRCLDSRSGGARFEFIGTAKQPDT